MSLKNLLKTIGLDSDRIAVLERLRHKRNVIDYTGEDMDEASVEVCIREAVNGKELYLGWVTGEEEYLYR